MIYRNIYMLSHIPNTVICRFMNTEVNHIRVLRRNATFSAEYVLPCLYKPTTIPNVSWVLRYKHRTDLYRLGKLLSHQDAVVLENTRGLGF